MLLSAVSVLVVAQLSSEIPEGLMNNPVQEAVWAPRPLWTGAENFASTGIRSPDRPARSELLYRLSYPGPLSF